MEEMTIEAIKTFENAVIKHPDISREKMYILMYKMLGLYGWDEEQREFETYYRAVCKRGKRK